MSDFSGGLQRLDLRSASEHEYACLGEFKNILNREYYPDDPPIPLEEQIQGWKNIPAFVEFESAALWNSNGTKIIAAYDTAIYHTGDNEHAAEFRIEVLPEYRCQGLGCEILKPIVAFAKNHNRKLLITASSDRILAAATFLERVGARKGLESHFNQLKIAEFDRSLADRWLKKSSNLENAFQMGFWDGAYPEEQLTEITELFEELTNDQPRDDLELEDMKVTPEMVRQIEESLFAKDNKRWTLYLMDRANGKFIGLTEVVWSPNRPSILNQGFTAVYPAYRNKGLGRWLKAEMMRKILSERPEVQFIRTGNANSNAPMLKINNEMGFKPYHASTIWQGDTAQIENYLEERNTRQ